MDWPVISLVIAVVIVGVLVYLAVLMTQKKGYTFDMMEYQTDFLAIENSLIRDNPLSFNAAVIEADKLLDKALCEMGVSGKTMGERLKNIGDSKFSQLNSVWHAHKLRNQIAHEPRFRLEYMQAKRALASYKQALKDLGAI